MKKYYVEVQNFNIDYRNDAMIYDDLDEAIKEYEKELQGLIDCNYLNNKEKTVCFGEAIFKTGESTNFKKNELGCCDVEEYYRMELDERKAMFNRLKNNKGKGIYL